MLVFYIVLIAVLITAGVTLTILHWMHWTVFVGMVAVAMLVPLPVNAISLSIAKDSQQTFNEYWSGYETSAYTDVVACQRDGSCDNTYSCDPYTVVETEFYTDSEGKQKTRLVTKTKYHSCPYSTEETTFYVDSTLRTFNIADSMMTGGEFRPGSGIPGGRVSEAPVAWVAAKARIDTGKPGGVTTVNSYKNLILGSERSLLKRYSNVIDDLKAAKLLPEVASGVTNFYFANKIHFVGELKGVDKKALSRDMSYLNGAIGTELRGDLHVVMVDSDELTISSEDYGNALLAYWQDSKVFGRNALAKNAIVLVVAVEPYSAPKPTAVETDATLVAPPVVVAEASKEPVIPSGAPVVKWARAFTGMPIGNEGLLQQLSSELPGTVIDDGFLGSPTFNIAKSKVIPTSGAVESIIWGANKFERVSMEAKDENDSGLGFSYLSDDWQPDAGTLTLIYVLSGILSGLALAFGVYLSIAARSNEAYDFVRHLFVKH